MRNDRNGRAAPHAVDGSVGICALAAKALSEAKKGDLYAMAECISQCDHCCDDWRLWSEL